MLPSCCIRGIPSAWSTSMGSGRSGLPIPWSRLGPADAASMSSLGQRWAHQCASRPSRLPQHITWAIQLNVPVLFWQATNLLCSSCGDGVNISPPKGCSPCGTHHACMMLHPATRTPAAHLPCSAGPPPCRLSACLPCLPWAPWWGAQLLRARGCMAPPGRPWLPSMPACSSCCASSRWLAPLWCEQSTGCRSPTADPPQFQLAGPGSVATGISRNSIWFRASTAAAAIRPNS
jgi:hypothetical protein